MRVRVVLTGAPCSGKTTVLNALKEAFKSDPTYRFVDEIATKYVREEQSKGLDPYKDLKTFEEAMIKLQKEAEDAHNHDNTCTIIDRSMIDHLAIIKNLKVEKKNNIHYYWDLKDRFNDEAISRNYHLVFVLDRLDFVKTSDRRENGDEEAILQDHYLRRTYHKLQKMCGYKIIPVPKLSVEERVDLIVKEIKQHQLTMQPASPQLGK
jgi:predicted ATPase